MTTLESACDERRLKALLAGSPADSSEVEIERHLEHCADCRRRLTELAADPSDWRDASDLLREAVGGELYRAERPRGAWSLDTTQIEAICSGTEPATRHHLDAAQYTAAMVRPLLAPPSHPEMLGRLGRYEIERLIGSGGMGIVLKGFDTELNRPVAIKILAPHLAHHGAARQRFAREGRAAAAIVHEHVVAIHNVETAGTSPFLVMQFVAGESLQTRLDRQGPFEVCEVLRIAHQTAAGLAAAHAQGLVHRDVKPSNILLEEGIERALLTDFGLARASDDASLTHTGYLPGTPHYMSPEQARGEEVDPRSDLFSLGSVLYALCAGRPPFRAETSFGVLRRITDDEPRPLREINPAIPDWLANLIAHLLAKNPADRCGSAQELSVALAACLAHLQRPSANPLPELCRARATQRSESLRHDRLRRASGILGGILLAAVVFAAVVLAVQKNSPPQSLPNARDALVPVEPPPDEPNTQLWNLLDEPLEAIRIEADRLERDLQSPDRDEPEPPRS